MNGRIYDPLLGRFLSADIVVQAPGDLQSYNRYSYVRNNPLTLIDPTGFLDEMAFGTQLARWGSAGSDFLGEMESQSAAGWAYKSFTSDNLNAKTGGGTVGGVTSRGNSTIYVQDKADMKDTIDSTVHETEHSKQSAHTTVGERKNNERGAYRRQGQFQIDTGRRSEFTKREKNKTTGTYEDRIDDAAIDAHVIAHYPNPVDPKTGKPVSDSQRSASGTVTDSQLNGVEVVDVNMVRLAYTAEAAKAAAKTAKQEAKQANRAAKKASTEQRAEAQINAADARTRAEQAEAAAKQAREAAEQERKRLKQTRGY
ncbi:MAG: RHS repeat-associated core domain-containing protein [Opitutaceae bacterium]